MAEDLILKSENKDERYNELLLQLSGLINNETDAIANLANTCAALKYGMGFFWVGFYFVKGDQLVLGPFQGPVACTRIAYGKGVCGTAWLQKKTLIVDDVEKFPGHIACSSLSKSEIVVPLFDQSGNVIGVLDVDSDALSTFDKTDELFLKQIAALLNFRNA